MRPRRQQTSRQPCPLPPQLLPAPTTLDADSDEWNDLKGSPWGGVGGAAAPAADAASWVGIFCNDTLKNATSYFTMAMQTGGEDALAAVAALELPDYTCGEDDVR